ncbi:hypothetical protein DL93DRAFT_2173883 [Clavulina sp. PMI_390]|nr:hypothetical protein DL93DRAFT_2173883 [Clavulina sp. PMI_390]
MMDTTPAQSPSFYSPGPVDHINKLPPEIMSYVLLLLMLPLDDSVWDSPATSTCAYWRKCAIDTPRIWSCIRITSPYAKERVECRLKRSGSVPLHLFIRGTPPTGIFDLFLDTHHLQTMTVRSTRRDLAFIPPLPFNASNLKELDVSMRPTNLAQMFPFGFPKHLTCLRLTSFQNRQFALGGIDLPYLKELYIYDKFNTDDVVHILRSASDLRTLEWHSKRRVASDEIWPPELPHLWSLTLEGSSHIHHMVQISMPSLTHLLLSFTEITPERASETCMRLRSFPTLTHFVLWTEVKLTTNDVLTICHSLPNLEYFDIPWHDGNLPGILALCGAPPPYLKGTSPAQADSAPGSTSWACVKMRRCYLGVSDPIDDGTLSPQTAASCITTLLTKRAVSLGSTSSAEHVPPSPHLPFIVVLDVKNPAWLLMPPDNSSILPPNCVEYVPYDDFPWIDSDLKLR